MTVRAELTHVFTLFNQLYAAHLRKSISDGEFRRLLRALEERRAMLLRAIH